MPAISSLADLDPVQNEMRRQDDNFNTRLTKMRKDIEDVNSACWHQNILNSGEKPDESLSSHLEENTGNNKSQALGSTVKSSQEEAIGLDRTTWTIDERRSSTPHLTQDQSVQHASPAGRLVSESPLPTTFPPRLTAAMLTKKRASEGSVRVPALSTKSVPSLPGSPPPSFNSHGGIRQGRSTQRRGSLGTWLLKKFQIN